MGERISVTSFSLWAALRKESKGSLSFRPANRMDIPTLVPLINSAYLYENQGEAAFKLPDAVRTDPSSLEANMTDGVIIVATNPVTGQIYGSVHYKEIPATEGSGSDQETNAYFGMLAVDPQFQGQGHGEKLLKLAEEIGSQRGRRVMEIQVINHTKRLFELYTKHGYREFGQSEWNENFLTKPTHFVLMSKPLQPAINPAA